MLPNANDLHSFLELTGTSNMSRAAERLGLSQPALSQAIKRLEESFGQALFIRSKSGVKLTKAGMKLAVKARSFLDEWQKLKDDALKDQQELRGRYTLGVHPSVALYTLKYFLPQILQHYSDLEIHLQHDLSRKIAEDVVSFKVDFGLVVNPFPHPDLVIRELFSDQVTFWKSKRETATNRWGEKDCVLLLQPELLQTRDLMAKISHGPKKKQLFGRTMTSTNLEVIARLTAEGIGVGILPTRVAHNENKNLELVDAKLPAFTDKICLVYRADAHQGQASKKMLATIFEELKAR